MIYRAITFHFYSFETWISTASAAALMGGCVPLSGCPAVNMRPRMPGCNTSHRGSQQHNHGGTTPAIDDHNSTTREAHHHPSRITTAQPWRHNTSHRGSQQQGHEAIIYINRYIIVFIYLLNSIKILIYWLFYFGILVFMCIFAANLITKQKYKDYGKRFGYLLRDARRR